MHMKFLPEHNPCNKNCVWAIFTLMSLKTYAIITDIHSNVESLNRALQIINDRYSVDQIVCLGDCFAIGPEPKATLEVLQNLGNCIFIRGNHDRYLVEKLWEEEQPSLEGMDPDDPICQAIVANEKWTYEELGNAGIEFLNSIDRKSTRLNSSHTDISRMPSSA